MSNEIKEIVKPEWETLDDLDRTEHKLSRCDCGSSLVRVVESPIISDEKEVGRDYTIMCAKCGHQVFGFTDYWDCEHCPVNNNPTSKPKKNTSNKSHPPYDIGQELFLKAGRYISPSKSYPSNDYVDTISTTNYVTTPIGVPKNGVIVKNCVRFGDKKGSVVEVGCSNAFFVPYEEQVKYNKKYESNMLSTIRLMKDYHTNCNSHEFALYLRDIHPETKIYYIKELNYYVAKYKSYYYDINGYFDFNDYGYVEPIEVNTRLSKPNNKPPSKINIFDLHRLIQELPVELNSFITMFRNNLPEKLKEKLETYHFTSYVYKDRTLLFKTSNFPVYNDDRELTEQCYSVFKGKIERIVKNYIDGDFEVDVHGIMGYIKISW